MQLSFWADQLNFKGLSVQSGELNGELWATWEEGRWDSVQSLFDVRALNMLRDQRPLPVVDQASGNLFWETTPSGWQLAIDRFDLQTSILSWKIINCIFQQKAMHDNCAWGMWRYVI